jgi:hypothetical protein
MSSQDIYAICLVVIQALEKSNIAYEVGGALASSLHGAHRSTADADIVADIRPQQTQSFIQNLGAGFFAQADAISDSIRQGRSFNIIHLDTMLKIDIYPVKDNPFAISRFSRRKQLPFFTAVGPLVWFTSAEDIILQKLSWYHEGGKNSDRQWTDVIGVLRINKGALDEKYLDKWALSLGVSDLLNKARLEAQ